MRSWIMCVLVACAGVAAAAPGDDARAKHKAAAAEHGNGNYQKALELVDEGLAIAPKDLELLALKGTVLLELRNYAGALAVYEAYLKAGAKGANQRDAKKIVDKLRAVKTTFLEIAVTNGPGDVYLDSKAQGLFCRAEPSCNQAVLPDQYKVIVERPGYARWTGDVTVESGKTAKVAAALVEEPSLLTVRATPANARVTVDGAPHDAPARIAPGTRRVVVSLEGHVEEQRDVEAREGKPIELAVALTSLVPVRVEPPGAELRLDDQPVAIQDGRIAIPPGAHVLVARAPGFQDRKIEIPVERGVGYQLAIELERVPAAAPPPAPGGLTARRKLALEVGGVGVVAIAAGALFGLEKGQLQTPESLVLYAAGGLATLIAIDLWIKGAPRPPDARVTVAPRLVGGAGLELAVRF